MATETPATTSDNRNTDYATKYAKKLDQIFSERSLTAAYVSKEAAFKEDGGVASVYFRTVDTSDFLGGHTSSAFGSPSAVKSDVTRKDVELFYEINKNIPNVDLNDTAGALKEAGQVLATGIREQYSPFIDKLNIATAIKAATTYGGKNVVAYTEGKTKAGVDSMIATLKNAHSYSKTQALFVPASNETELMDAIADQFNPVKNDKMVETGVVGKYRGIDVVVVPDELFVTMTLTGTAPYAQATFTAAPTVKAVIWDKRVMKTCRKLYQTYVLTGKDAVTAGCDGPLLRGLFRPGAWVIDANGTNKAVAILKASGTTGAGK